MFKLSETQKTVSVVIIAVLLLLFAFYQLGGDSSGFTMQQFVGAIIAAAISGVITLLLLKGQDETQAKMLARQRKGEAERDKDVKIYSNKIVAYSAFNRAIWTEDLVDSQKPRVIIERIRKELYSKVILYLNATEINRIISIIPTDPQKCSTNFPVILSGIIDILNKNAEDNIDGTDKITTSGDKYQKACLELWDKFSAWSGLFAENDENEDEDIIPDNKSEEIVIDNKGGSFSSTRSLKMQAWHFCELSTTQLDKLDSGFNELSLVEYDEYWRTSLVKQVKPGDLVFLFIGSKRYAGVFIAKGWRVFEYNNNMVSEFTSENITPVLPQENYLIDSPDVIDILRKYDIYNSFEDGATTCANVVVEPISYSREGVDNPNTTYRKTISRYYEGYAIKLLESFRDKDPNLENKAKIEKLLNP